MITLRKLYITCSVNYFLSFKKSTYINLSKFILNKIIFVKKYYCIVHCSIIIKIEFFTNEIITFIFNKVNFAN